MSRFWLSIWRNVAFFLIGFVGGVIACHGGLIKIVTK